MPHDLSIIHEDMGDRAEMMYTGETPWHGLGTKLDNPATAVEAIQAAHLDWTVAGSPVYMMDTEPTNQPSGLISHRQIEIPGYQAIHRTDTGKVFGIMTDRYEVVQNEDAWTFMDTVLGPGEAHYHTAGALREGRVVWILAKLDGTVEIVKGDPVEKYLLLVTSHDGSLSLQIHTTPIRAVCGNTVTAALAHGRQYVAIKHTSSVHRRIEQAQKALAQGEAYFHDMVMEARQLSRHQMNEKDMAAFTKALLEIHPQTIRKINSQTESAERQINELFITGKGQDNPMVWGTAWAAYNAVTEYIDYRSTVQRVGGGQGSLVAQDRRLHRSWFGKGQDMRNRAWSLLRNHRLRGASAFEVSDPQHRTRYTDAAWLAGGSR